MDNQQLARVVAAVVPYQEKVLLELVELVVVVMVVMMMHTKDILVLLG